MNWTGITENVIAAVVGALILSFVYWAVSTFRRGTPIRWYETDSGHTKFEKNEQKSSVAYCSVLLVNETRNIVRDVEVMFNGPVHTVHGPKGAKFEIVSGDEYDRLVIGAIQPKSQVKIQAQRKDAYYICADKVFVGDIDVGYSKSFKLVATDSIVLPSWFGIFVFPVLIGLFSMLSLSHVLDVAAPNDLPKQSETGDSVSSDGAKKE